MGIKVNFSTKITVNGKEYASIDSLPPDVRAAYEKAMASRGQGGGPVMIKSTTTKIVFNGQEYASAEAMPADVRGLYDQVMQTVAATRTGAPDALAAGASNAADGESRGAGHGALLQASKPRRYDRGGTPGRRRTSAALTAVVLGVAFALVLAFLLVAFMRVRHAVP